MAPKRKELSSGEGGESHERSEPCLRSSKRIRKPSKKARQEQTTIDFSSNAPGTLRSPCSRPLNEAAKASVQCGEDSYSSDQIEKEPRSQNPAEKNTPPNTMTIIEEESDVVPDNTVGPNIIKAKDLIEKKRAIHHNRRSKKEGPGTSTTKSLCKFIASQLDPENQTFYCNVCKFVGKLNKGISTSNIINHYVSKHKRVYDKLLIINSKNGRE